MNKFEYDLFWTDRDMSGAINREIYDDTSWKVSSLVLDD